MQVFGEDNGCLVLAKVSVQKSRGATLSVGSEAPGNTLVVGVSFIEKEKYAGLPGLRGNDFLYSFGRDALGSSCSISFLCPLTESKTVSGISSIIELYKKGRLSNGKISTLTFGSEKQLIRGRLIAMQSQTQDVKLNLQLVTLTMILAGL